MPHLLCLQFSLAVSALASDLKKGLFLQAVQGLAELALLCPRSICLCSSIVAALASPHQASTQTERIKADTNAEMLGHGLIVVSVEMEFIASVLGHNRVLHVILTMRAVLQR